MRAGSPLGSRLVMMRAAEPPEEEPDTWALG
jgi:hypothetical protein